MTYRYLFRIAVLLLLPFLIGAANANQMAYKAISFFLNDPNPITAAKLANFTDYMNTYKSLGINTVVLITFVPVDSSNGNIENQFLTTNQFHHLAVAPGYVGQFTDAAHSLGLKVFWKPHFSVDDSRGENVNDFNLGPTFYPNGTTFSVNNFLANVNSFWAQWARVAQQHGVEGLVLGVEQGLFTSSTYTSQ